MATEDMFSCVFVTFVTFVAFVVKFLSCEIDSLCC